MPRNLTWLVGLPGWSQNSKAAVSLLRGSDLPVSTLNRFISNIKMRLKTDLKDNSTCHFGGSEWDEWGCAQAVGSDTRCWLWEDSSFWKMEQSCGSRAKLAREANVPGGAQGCGRLTLALPS